jgi:hypothetical protein
LTTGFGMNVGTKGLYNTLDALRWGATTSGKNLRASDFYTAQTYFEASFKYGYGYAANSFWQYASYKSTSYLYGKWWYVFFT